MTILDDAREGMNPDIRPQDDLFGHVNGTWLELAEIPSDRSSWGPFISLADTAEQQVHAIIEELAAGSAPTRPPTPRTPARSRPLLLLHGRPTPSSRPGHRPHRAADRRRSRPCSDLRGLATFLGGFERKGGSGALRLLRRHRRPQTSDRYLVNITQGGLGLPDESYYREEKFAEIRETYLAYLTRALRARRPAATPTRRRGRGAGPGDPAGRGPLGARGDPRRHKTYNLVTRAELRGARPAFDFDAWVTALGGTDETIAEAVVRQPSYLEHLSTVLAEVPIERLAGLPAVQAIRTAAAYLTGDFVEANFDFYGRTLSGTPELRERWKRGVGLVEGALGEAVGREYVARHFPPRSKELMDELVANLLEAYRRSITDLDWMTEETKQRAFDKLDTFRPEDRLPGEVPRLLRARGHAPTTCSATCSAATAFETDRELGKIGAPVDRDEWFMLPQTVNAYYNPGTNEICFPAGILQKPFFDPDADPAENYGGIGAVIGHEIGHGFDDQGAQYDGAGNLNDWWTADDKAAFEVKSKALIDAVRRLRAARPARREGQRRPHRRREHRRPRRPDHRPQGLPDRLGRPGRSRRPTGAQRVFLNWAYVLAHQAAQGAGRSSTSRSTRTRPPEFRANIVRNLDEFHEAFGTAAGDGLWLDPEDRVRIW